MRKYTYVFSLSVINFEVYLQYINLQIHKIVKENLYAGLLIKKKINTVSNGTSQKYNKRSVLSQDGACYPLKKVNISRKTEDKRRYKKQRHLYFKYLNLDDK